MENQQIPSWITLSHSRGFSNLRKMEFLIKVVHQQEITLEDALSAIETGDTLGFDFKEKELEGLKAEIAQLPNYAFLAEELSNQGISCINVMEKYVYPQALKKNLKKHAPLLLYAKGNADLLQQPSIAIVGARKSNERSLEFTDRVAKNAVSGKKVVVSGFAKGVDRKALDSALYYGGSSIIVLPQGILTYTSKAYYQALVQGKVLILSSYHPKARWSVGLAMDRNKTIYGLAEAIYAAQSDSKGGTWSGVLDGIKRGRTIYIRYPEADEKNANLELIRRGALAVNMDGEVLHKEGLPHSKPASDLAPAVPENSNDTGTSTSSNEDAPTPSISTPQELIREVVSLLQVRKGKGITAQNIKEELALEEAIEKKVTKELNKSDLLIKSGKKGSYNLYKLKSLLPAQGEIFS